MKRLYDDIKDWMINYKKTSVKATTYDRLLVSLEMMGRYPIADISIEELEDDDIQNYLNRLVDEGYARSTVKKQFYLIREFLDRAVLKGMISRPIYKGVKLPSESIVKKRKKEVVAYTKAEQKALREVLESVDDPAYKAALIMMETGMRIGETLALGWNDVDFSRRALRISKTVVRITDSKRSYIQMGAKSYSSNRTIPLSKNAIDILTGMKEEDEFGDLVFHDKNGEMLTYETLRWRTQKACKQAGVKYYGQHVFRHTFATNCYEKGCDVKRLSKLLGHQNVTITYNVYIHLFGDGLEDLRSVVD